jgi:hypothetical protein
MDGFNIFIEINRSINICNLTIQKEENNKNETIEKNIERI